LDAAGPSGFIRSANGDFVYTRPISPTSLEECLWYAWDEAQETCDAAYDAWCSGSGSAAYAVYVAERDRADAAQDALAAVHRSGASHGATTTSPAIPPDGGDLVEPRWSVLLALLGFHA